MYDQAVDGNVEALKQYERLQVAQETALEGILEAPVFQEKLDAIQVLAQELHDLYDSSTQWDFSNEIAEAIKEVV